MSVTTTDRAPERTPPEDNPVAEDPGQHQPSGERGAPAAKSGMATAALAALGIVFGDLGTSPLYTMQTVVGTTGGTVTPEIALGVLSLIFWALVITISIKYCLLVMRADNHGEGGILALMSLVGRGGKGRAYVLVAFGLFGAALIYGDGIITPAISVLSALEGVNVATPALKPYVLPAAVVVLIALFTGQTLGTAKIGRVFGPLMLVWFVTIGVLGAVSAAHHPEIVAAIDPSHAVRLLASRGWGSFVVLGGVFLAITGGEALYADMGHVGRTPTRITWYGIVLPGLLLCYAGQAATLIDHPNLSGNPFFAIVPGWGLYPMVALATLATIIASQAIITGSFSLTRQAIQLGWFPGVRIRQTSEVEYGQIYIPAVNWPMMGCTVALALGFGSSDRLAGAYGTAVSTTMLLTTALLFACMRERWRWSLPLAASVAATLLIVDLAFFGANLMKIRDGGWIPLLLGALIYTTMRTWRKGIEAIRQRFYGQLTPPDVFLRQLDEGTIPRVPGTAAFLTQSSAPVPVLMARHVAQFGALHETVVTMTVRFEEYPRVPTEKRVEVTQVTNGLWHVTVRFGFIDTPNLPAALACARECGCPVDLDSAIYFGSRDEVVRSVTAPRLSGWRRMLFGFMYRNAVHMVDRFDLPPARFVEIGRQVAL